MEVWSPNPACNFIRVIFWTARSPAKTAALYQFRNAFVMEPQHYPDRRINLISSMVFADSGETYHNTIII